MHYQAFIGRLRNIAEELEKDSHFQTVIEIERGFSSLEFGDLRLSMDSYGIENVPLSNELCQFYSAANGLLFQWLYNGDQPIKHKTASAEIAMVQQIYLPEQLLNSPKIKLFYDQKRPFDRVSPDEQVAVMFTEGDPSPQLHYFSDETGDFHRMLLSFDEYLETLLEARAMYGWQKFFVEDAKAAFTKKEAEEFRQSLKTLFPSANLAHFARL